MGRWRRRGLNCLFRRSEGPYIWAYQSTSTIAKVGITKRWRPRCVGWLDGRWFWALCDIHRLLVTCSQVLWSGNLANALQCLPGPPGNIKEPQLSSQLASDSLTSVSPTSMNCTPSPAVMRARRNGSCGLTRAAHGHQVHACHRQACSRASRDGHVAIQMAVSIVTARGRLCINAI